MSSFTALQSTIRDVQFGTNVKLVEPCNLFECVIGNDCFIGPFVEIQRDVTIGDRSKIQSHSFICSLVTIGKDCFIGHGVMFVNDRFRAGKPAAGNTEHWESTIIEDYVSIGSNATILPVHICSHVVIGAGAVVTKSITEPGIYAGNPAVLVRKLGGGRP
jgi:acetyltransferase-like isoleucine patch superfamily enzyme